MTIAFFYALAFLFWRGFVFNSADQSEPLPLVYKLLNPELYPVDFYVQAATDIFTIRFYYVHVLAFLGQWFPMEGLCFVLTLFCLTISVIAWMKIARLISSNDTFGYLAPFFIFFLFYSWTIGGNAVQYNLFISSTIAKTLAPWALYSALKRRWVWAGVLIGIAGIFQVLVGLQLALILGFILFCALQWKPLLLFSTAVVLAIAPMLLPILYRQFFLPVEVEESLYYEILFRWRNPHHYLPSLFTLSAYIKGAALWVLGIVTAWIVFSKVAFRKYLALSATIVLGLVLYTLCIEFLGINSIGKLQWFKTTIWLQAFAALAISIGVERLLVKYFASKYLPVFPVLLLFFWMTQSHVRHQTPLAFDHRTEEQKELSELHAWIAIYTPVDALFATYATDESFQSEAKRSVYVAWVPMVHEPWYLVAWFERFYTLYRYPFDGSDYKGTLDRAAENYDKGKFSDLPEITHAIIKNNVRPDREFEVLKAGKTYKIVRFQ